MVCAALYMLIERSVCVALGTGVKCLGAKQYTAFGDVVLDSHAEVLAKRSFQRYNSPLNSLSTIETISCWKGVIMIVDLTSGMLDICTSKCYERWSHQTKPVTSSTAIRRKIRHSA